MESETEEWKESWRKEYLASICAFANKNGGTMILGKTDKGKIVGVSNPKKMLEEIPNTVRNVLRFSPEVHAVTENGKTIIVVRVEPQKKAVDCEGVYFTRSGSTSVALTGDQLGRFLLKKEGISWADLPDEKVKAEDLSQEAIDIFIQAGLKSRRMSPEAAHSDRETLLRNYGLMDDEGLKRSAAILFLPRTTRYSYSADTKIGAFGKNGLLLRDDWIDGPVISRPDRIMKVLLEKYIQGTYDIDGLRRITVYPYPVKAIREAVMNATIHRDYSSRIETSIKVFPDRVEIFNPGTLPQGWTADNLLKKHASEPANESIAKVFYDMEYIEKWGNGIPMMRDECVAMGLPEPEYNVMTNGVEIVFRLPEKKGAGIPLSLPEGLTENEIKICKLIKENERITYIEMAEQLGISESTVTRAARSLSKKGIIKRMGPERGGSWKLLL